MNHRPLGIGATAFFCFWGSACAASTHELPTTAAFRDRPVHLRSAHAIDDVVARVNGVPIFAIDLNRRARALTDLGDDPARARTVEAIVLARLIDTELLVQEARRIGVSVTESQLRQRLESLARGDNRSVASWEKAWLDRGLTADEVREDVRRRLTGEKVLEIEVRRRLPRPEVDWARVLHAWMLTGSVVTILHAPSASLATSEALDALVRRARADGRLCSVSDARADLRCTVLTSDATQIPGGQLADAIYLLEPGEISDPIAGRDGADIVQVVGAESSLAQTDSRLHWSDHEARLAHAEQERLGELRQHARIVVDPTIRSELEAARRRPCRRW